MLMDFFLKLEFNKLIKELDFIDSDLMYKSSLIKVADENFIRDVNKVLETFPQLKQLVDEKTKIRMEVLNQVPPPVETHYNDSQVEDEEEIIYDSKDPKLKTLYRQIARSTHPDVMGQENLKEVYLDAQKAYDSNNIIQILSICDRLKINYEITKQEFDLIKDEINHKRQRIQFLESTYTWKWYHVESIEEKSRIILDYLGAQVTK